MYCKTCKKNRDGRYRDSKEGPWKCPVDGTILQERAGSRDVSRKFAHKSPRQMVFDHLGGKFPPDPNLKG